jgi:type II secretory pathway pseudopilin PulG
MINNERGSTLLIVLLIITLLLIFGLALLGNTVSSAKQNSKTEKNMQATHLAEMGVTHLQERLNRLTINELKIVNQDTVKPLLENIAQTITNPHLPLDEKSYKVTKVDVTHTNNTSTATFLVEGKTKNESVTLKPSFTLTYPKGYSSVLDIENNLHPEKLANPYKTINNSHSIPMDETEEFGNVQFNKGVSMGSGSTLITKDAQFIDNITMNQNSTLNIQGDGQFEGLDGASGSQIMVGGNAFFTQRFIITKDISLLHIKGDAKFHNGFELTAGPKATIEGSMYFDARGQNLQIEAGGLLTINGDLFIRMTDFRDWFLDLRGTIIVKGNIHLAMTNSKSRKEEILINPTQIGIATVKEGIPIDNKGLKNGTIYIGKDSTKSGWNASLNSVEY